MNIFDQKLNIFGQKCPEIPLFPTIHRFLPCVSGSVAPMGLNIRGRRHDAGVPFGFASLHHLPMPWPALTGFYHTAPIGKKSGARESPSGATYREETTRRRGSVRLRLTAPPAYALTSPNGLLPHTAPAAITQAPAGRLGHRQGFRCAPPLCTADILTTISPVRGDRVRRGCGTGWGSGPARA